MEETFSALARPVIERQRKPKLGVRNTAVRVLVDSLPCETPDRRGGVYAFAEWIIAGARTFTAAKRRAGLFSPKPLSKTEAAEALRKALAQVGGARG
ncbi:hypothetical protein A3736_01840 [Erythrobacter sp. HI0063]|uniref:hypothetical protein n=1 Tax=Erythrobacter sp. HI0063 TaxID=1822240 RepID=UPI0007C3DCE9|nr:hypothetical protein [Erythrobacter sp. HI0063]KZY55393.1 hypothetical protein A3736_01840 [Erythrobacter sp. HI0063]